jgi:hypothetical protein
MIYGMVKLYQKPLYRSVTLNIHIIEGKKITHTAAHQWHIYLISQIIITIKIVDIKTNDLIIFLPTKYKGDFILTQQEAFEYYYFVLDN